MLLSTTHYYSKMTFFHKSSIELLKKIPKELQKKDHIEFTHPNVVQKIVSIITQQYQNQSSDFIPKNILEPGCGSGEFLYVLQKTFPQSDIVGIDKNKTIVDTIKKNFSSNVSIEHKNFFSIQRRFDLIIGWAPFYMMNKTDVSRNQQSMIEGRPNSSVLYLLQACELIETNGIIAFILPASVLSGLSYHILRDIINTHYQIISIFDVECKLQKNNIVLIIQKKTSPNNQLFTCQVRNCIVFNEPEKTSKLKSLMGDTTINSLLLDVKIGTIIWNSYKHCLTNDPIKTQLIYSSNVKNNSFVQFTTNDPEKKQYIDKEGIIDPVIVVNRGDGKSKFQLKFCLLDQETPFLVENHLMYIYSNQIIPRDEKVSRLRIVQKSLEDPRTISFIHLYFGYSAMNASELKYILPVYT